MDQMSDQMDGKSVKDILKSKNPVAKRQGPDCVIQDSEPLSYHLSIIDEFDDYLFKNAGQKTTRA